MTVRLDLTAQAAIRHDASGITATRRGLITGVEGNPEQRARNALETLGLPRYGDPHPSIAGLRVADVILEAVDTSQWSVTIIYREPQPEELAFMKPLGQVADIEWFSASVTVDKLFDNAGNRLFHWYSGYPKVLSISFGRIREVVSSSRRLGTKAERASVQVPSVGVRVLIPEAADPRSRLGLIGHVNRAPWSGYGSRTWLFLGHSSGRLERGRWLNTYELLYRSDTWDLESVIELEGVAPSDARLGNGIARFQVYNTANFNQLGFSL